MLHLTTILVAILIGEFPTCLGVYEYIPNNFSKSLSQPPYFDFSMERNVTSFVSQTTHLHCTVNKLGDKTVSWIRKSDLHVLTSGVQTFTGDLRFSAHQSRTSGGADSWTLQIKSTQIRDAGEYQCQVNTEPKISFSVFLAVEEARARIEGPDNKEVHVKQRSRVKLTCVVDLGRGHSQESAAVFWYLDGESLDWLGQTGPGRGVQVTEQRGQQLISTLLIEKADMHHAGKFTCSPSYAKPDTVTLHVIDGESRAELQGNDGGNSASSQASTASTTSPARWSFLFNTFLTTVFFSLICTNLSCLSCCPCYSFCGSSSSSSFSSSSSS